MGFAGNAKSKDAADGWNGDREGYTNNTRDGPGKHSGETDPDRHCKRPTHNGKAMKCQRCSHYYQQAKGCCANCGYSNKW